MGGSETISRPEGFSQAIRRARSSTLPVVGLTLGLIVIGFGPVIPWLGYYWDDWPTLWFLHFKGPAGFIDIFSVDRPLLGYLFSATTALLGENPLTWQVFGLLTRWVSALAFWWALRAAWPQRSAQIAWAALLFAVYPGFKQQPLALTYSHSWLILAGFFISLGLHLRAARRDAGLPGPTWFWLAISWGLATLVMFTSEYFFGLELLRPVLLGLALLNSTHEEPAKNSGKTNKWQPASLVRKVGLHWLPYLASMGVFLFWRLVLHKTPRGEVMLLDQVQGEPGSSLTGLAATILSDIFEAGYLAWAETFGIRRLADLQTSQLLVYALVVGGAALAVFFSVLSTISPSREYGEVSPFRRYWKENGAAGLGMIGLGLFSLFIAGWPFWTTGLPIALTFPFDRFMLTMMPGAALLAAGLASLLPTPGEGRPYLSAAFLALLAGLAAGGNYFQASQYRQEWALQRDFFWQLSWRAPDIQPGTTLLTSELPHLHSSDYTLAAPLNWMYNPEDVPSELPYMLSDIKERLETDSGALEDFQEIQLLYRTSSFSGSTSQAVVLFYSPPRCLRVVKPDRDVLLPRKPRFIDQAIPLSRPELLMEAEKAAQPPQVLGPEPDHGWCYYFQKAELAWLSEDWTELTSLTREINQKGLEPGDWGTDEWMPFIAGMAHTSDWESAVELTRRAYESNPKLKDYYCSQWFYLLQDVPDSEGQASAAGEIKEQLGCRFP